MQRYLLQTNSNSVYIYTDALAAKKGMQEIPAAAAKRIQDGEHPDKVLKPVEMVTQDVPKAPKGMKLMAIPLALVHDVAFLIDSHEKPLKVEFSDSPAPIETVGPSPKELAEANQAKIDAMLPSVDEEFVDAPEPIEKEDAPPEEVRERPLEVVQIEKMRSKNKVEEFVKNLPDGYAMDLDRRETLENMKSKAIAIVKKMKADEMEAKKEGE